MALISSLISFWEMDEASGNRIDAHSGGNNLTDVGSPTRIGGVNGAFSVALTSGASYLYRSTNATLETGDIDWTLTGWTALNAWADYYSIISKYPATTTQQEYALYYYHDIDKLELVIRKGDDTGVVVVDSTVSIPTSDQGWHFYVIGHNAGTNQIFISVDNETLVSVANPATPGMHVGTGDFLIGGNVAGAAVNFNGWADQIGLWKRILTPTERIFLYNAGTGRSYAEIVAESAAETRTIAMSMVG